MGEVEVEGEREMRVVPEAGTVVLFEADATRHEVLSISIDAPDRYALTLWVMGQRRLARTSGALNGEGDGCEAGTAPALDALAEVGAGAGVEAGAGLGVGGEGHDALDGLAALALEELADDAAPSLSDDSTACVAPSTPSVCD